MDVVTWETLLRVLNKQTNLSESQRHNSAILRINSQPRSPITLSSLPWERILWFSVGDGRSAMNNLGWPRSWGAFFEICNGALYPPSIPIFSLRFRSPALQANVWPTWFVQASMGSVHLRGSAQVLLRRHRPKALPSRRRRTRRRQESARALQGWCACRWDVC